MPYFFHITYLFVIKYSVVARLISLPTFVKNLAALVTLKHLLQKNVKCRNLLENDAGGGSVSGSVAVSLLVLLFKASHILRRYFSN